MNIVADLHTHSIASTHAFSTIYENIEAASKKGLYAIALTDHGRAMDGAPGAYFFESLPLIDKEVSGVRVLKGIEANIIDYNGKLDADESLLKNLDWVIASMHSITILGKPTIEKCTKAYLSVSENENVNAIGHSGQTYFEYDFEKVVKSCRETGTLIEINNGTFSSRRDSIGNCREIARLCKKYGTRVVVDSDAHFTTYIGKVDSALKLLEEIDFPKELIINSSIENMQKYMQEKGIAI